MAGLIQCVNLMSTLHGSRQALGGARTRKAARLILIWKLWKLPPGGTVWKNQTTVFPHRSTGLGKLSAQKRSEFPTVPTASATTDPIAFSQKLYQGGLARFISVVTVEDSTPRASRNSHCHAAGKYAISKKLKPMQFLFSCNKYEHGC